MLVIEPKHEEWICFDEGDNHIGKIRAYKRGDKIAIAFDIPRHIKITRENYTRSAENANAGNTQ